LAGDDSEPSARHAVKVLAESVAQLPFHLYSRDDRGAIKREIDRPVGVPAHPFFRPAVEAARARVKAKIVQVVRRAIDKAK